MTTMSAKAGAGRRRFADRARNLRYRLAQTRQRQRLCREWAELAQLPDYLLRDMGLTDHVRPRHDPTPRNLR